MPLFVGGIDSKYTVLYIQKISGFNKDLTQLQLGKCTGWAYPHGSRIRVLMGTGTGNHSAICDL